MFIMNLNITCKSEVEDHPHSFIQTFMLKKEPIPSNVIRRKVLLGAIVAWGRHGGIGYGTGLCGLYVDGDWWRKKLLNVKQ